MSPLLRRHHCPEEASFEEAAGFFSNKSYDLACIIHFKYKEGGRFPCRPLAIQLSGIAYSGGYMASIIWPYFWLMTFLFTFMVGVISPVSCDHSVSSRVNFLICSTRA